LFLTDTDTDTVTCLVFPASCFLPTACSLFLLPLLFYYKCHLLLNKANHIFIKILFLYNRSNMIQKMKTCVMANSKEPFIFPAMDANISV